MLFAVNCEVRASAAALMLASSSASNRAFSALSRDSFAALILAVSCASTFASSELVLDSTSCMLGPKRCSKSRWAMRSRLGDGLFTLGWGVVSSSWAPGFESEAFAFTSLLRTISCQAEPRECHKEDTGAFFFCFFLAFLTCCFCSFESSVIFKGAIVLNGFSLSFAWRWASSGCLGEGRQCRTLSRRRLSCDNSSSYQAFISGSKRSPINPVDLSLLS
mmetsp:Transcript_24816/g.45142  ORF Transcript_24816/g.45142 Transcript_24816/m.45142 type:complete len:219 (-) Transcript_24816:1067-1723(-)